MLRNITLLLALLGLMAAYTWYDDYHHKPSFKTLNEELSATTHGKAPDFEFSTIDGKKLNLHDLQGRGIVLNFWASWCTPCVTELPQMIELAARNKRNVVFVFLSVDENTKDIRLFFQKQKLMTLPNNIIIGWDEDRKISQNLFLTTRFPETYLINSKGYINEKIIGMQNNWNSQEIQKRIDNLSWR